MNNYLIEGDNEILINKEIDKIIHNLKDIDIIKYDLSEKTIDDIIEALDTYDMFSHKKVIIAYNAPMFMNVIPDFNEKKFLKYLENPSDNILIIVNEKINNRLKIVKDISKYFKYIKISQPNINTFIKDNLLDYKMDYSTIAYFIDKVGSDYNEINQELLKLKLYKLEDKIIYKDDIDLICRKNFENTIFDLIDAIIKKEKKKTIKLYDNFINNGTDVFQMIGLLSSQIRLIYNVKVLSNLSDLEISKILDVKEYPVKLARSKGINYQKKELLNMLNNLGKIDEDIKSGKQLPDIAFISYILAI